MATALLFSLLLPNAVDPLSSQTQQKKLAPPRHPASIASLALAQALSSSSSSSPDVAGAAKAARDLSAALEGDKAKEESKGGAVGGGGRGGDDDDAETPPPPPTNDDDPSSKALKIAIAAGAVSSVSKALTLFEKSAELRRSSRRDLEALLRSLARLCSSDAGRDAAGAAGVPAKLCDLLAAVNNNASEEAEESENDDHDPDLVAAPASAAAAAATAHEGNKCALVDCGFGAAAAAALLRGGKSSSSASSVAAAVSPAAVRSLSAALCSLATADDPRPAASRAFQNGRTLGSEGVPAACLAAFRRAVVFAAGGGAKKEKEKQKEEHLSSESWLDTAAAAAMAARRSVVNDERCREFADAGGAEAVLRALLLSPPAAAAEVKEEEKTSPPSSSSSLSTQPLHHAKLARACCSLLRQLAGSDALKALIVDGGGFDLVTRAVAAHPGKHSVAEQALGLLVALTLRNPDACAAAVEAGCVRAAADVLRSGPSGSKDEAEDDHDDGENAAPPSSTNEKKSNSNSNSNSSSSSPPTAAAAAFSRNPHQWAQRQACAAIRNVVSRSLELRPLLLSPGQGGVEPLLRRARDRYPAACGDVGAAALRDLGCDDYDGKKARKEKMMMMGGASASASASAARDSSNSKGDEERASAARAAADGRFGVAV